MRYSKTCEDFFISLYIKLKSKLIFFQDIHTKVCQHYLKTKFVKSSEINLVLVQFIKFKSNNHLFCFTKYRYDSVLLIDFEMKIRLIISIYIHLCHPGFLLVHLYFVPELSREKKTKKLMNHLTSALTRHFCEKTFHFSFTYCVS